MEHQKKIFGLQKNVFFLGLVSLFNDFSSEMIYSVMPVFLTTVLGAPPVLVGLLEGFADALASFLKIYFGWFSDLIRQRKILSVIGYFISVSTRWFLAGVGNFWDVFLLRAVDRVGKGLRDSPRDALISESVEFSNLGRSFGYHRAMDAIGSMLGPLAAVIILPLIFNDYRLLFKFGFIIGFIAIILFIFVKDVKHHPLKNEKKISKHFHFSLRGYSHTFKVYILAVFIFGLGFLPTALMLLKSREMGLSDFSVPLMYFIYSTAFVIFAIPAGRLSDKVGERTVLILGFIAAIISYIIFFFSSNFLAVTVGFIILGLYSAMTDGVERALASKLAPFERLASSQGYLNASVGISSLLAGIIGGSIWTYWGSSMAMLYGIIMMIFGLLTFMYLNGFRKEMYN